MSFLLNYFSYYIFIGSQLCRYIKSMLISSRHSVKLVDSNFSVSIHSMDVHARVMRSNNELFIIRDLWVCSYNDSFGVGNLFIFYFMEYFS